MLLTIPVDQNLIGFKGTAGVRHMLTERVELFGSMTAEAADVTGRNFIFFDLGTRYDFTNWLAGSAAVRLGTDAHVGLVLGLRLYYDELLGR